MLRIALKNLLHDRMRLVAAILGVGFSVVLVTFQVGLFHLFVRNASAIIDHSAAAIWITSPRVANFEYGSTLEERVYHQARAVRGVGKAERVVFFFARMRMPSGAYEGVQVVGIDFAAGPSVPWEFSRGSIEDLRAPEAISLDDTDLVKLGSPRLGEIVEINDRRARVAAITHQHRSFTISPFVFTSLENAYRLSSLAIPGEFTYLLLSPEPGVKPEALIPELKRIPGVDVLRTDELASRSRTYWIFRTGAGFALGLSTLLGLVVGTVIVGQTIYSSTLDRIREFGTLKAIGAANGHLYRLIISQALLYAAGGYALGMSAATLVARLAAGVGSPILLSPSLAAGMLGATAAMCVAASILSIVRVTRLEPGTVFKA
jgi:putative ABC transport system permease protein